MFPAIANWLVLDSYFTVNSYYRTAPYVNRTTALPDVWRKEKDLSHLTACYSDVDCGRPESDEPSQRQDWRAAQHNAQLLMDAGVIPQASIMARSGRGIYLFWLLRDWSDPMKLQKAWPEKILLYKSINRALDQRLRDQQLPADLRAIDAARVLRVPGSVHRKARRRVTYIVQLDQYGKGFVYTLPELAQFLKLAAVDADLPDNTRALAKPAKWRRVKNPGSAPARSYGMRRLNALRAQDLLIIAQAKGGICKRGMKYPDGSTSCGRRFTLTLYANFLCGCGETQSTTLDKLRELAAGMKPPYPSDPPDQDPPLETLTEEEYSTKKRRRWSNAKLCALYGITAQKAREWNLQTVVPVKVAEERHQSRPTQKQRAEEATEWLRVYIEEVAQCWPSCRVAARMLTENGYPCTHATTAKYLKTLEPISKQFGELEVIRRRGGRPRKKR